MDRFYWATRLIGLIVLLCAATLPIDCLRPMHLPEKPSSFKELDLMKRLRAYSDGQQTWHGGGRILGPHEQAACQQLYANLCSLIEQCLHPLMDRVTAREMQGFTMHDRSHGIKVAHLMWHILLPSRRDTLSPGEIALLVTSAHLHDLGMGLSEDERATRLGPSSDLWDSLDPDSDYSKAISRLSDLAASGAAGEATTQDALHQVQQAQEALLCTDCRNRHATRDRYHQLLDALAHFHRLDPVNIINPSMALSFDGNSFLEKLVEICVSHNEDAHVLVDPDPTNSEQWRFPIRYPIGCCTADTRLVAAALRLADILDFDRERTPPILFRYLLPQSDDPRENVSIREWSKHLAISSWTIDAERIIFRGRSPSAFIHHVIVEFCHTIEDEIRSTKSIYADGDWAFLLKPNVEAAIETTDYRYIPYRFSLDEQKIYDLLMGRNIYHNRLDAIRELIQNGVDACNLRDSLMLSHDRTVTPSKRARIVIRYEEPNDHRRSARLSVIDSGAGMDRYVIENFFLKVGRSYYKSSEFLETRSQLRKRGLDFAPVAEFGIGFMAVFMLGDLVEVETALWSPKRQDTQRRTLRIDGLGRLIEVREAENTGSARFYGTRVSVQLTSRKGPAPTWHEVKQYIEDVCRNLDFSLMLEHVNSEGTEASELQAEGLKVLVPSHLSDTALRIPVDDPDVGLRGEIVIYRAPESKTAEEALAETNPLGVHAKEGARRWRGDGILLRGGFSIGEVPGLPRFILTQPADARVEVQKITARARSLPTTDLSRSRLSDGQEIENSIFKIWLSALLDRLDDVEVRPIGAPDVYPELLRRARWLEKYNAFDLYRVARTAWLCTFQDSKATEHLQEWESGKGSRIWCGDSYSNRLSTTIFDLILPKVTSIVVGDKATYYARPPISAWREKLLSWNSFVTENLDWARFAEYSSSVKNDLYDVYSSDNFLNKRYESQLAGFDESEIERFPKLLEQLSNARDRGTQAKFTSTDIALLNRLADAAGDLTINRFGTRRAVSDLVKGQSHTSAP
jgi:hypothetical protein